MAIPGNPESVDRSAYEPRLLIERTALLESAADGIYAIDAAGNCTFVNRSAAQMLGYTQGECLGQNMHALIHHHRENGSLYPVGECPIYRTVSTAKGAWIENEVAWRKDGTPIPVEYATQPVIIEGRVEGAVVNMRDISDRKRTQQRLEVQYAVSQVLAMAGNETDFDLSRAGNLLLENIGKSLGWVHGSFWHLDRSAQVLRCRGVWQAESFQSDRFNEITRNLALGFGEGLPGMVWESGVPTSLSDITVQDFPRAAAAREAGLHGVFAFPVATADEFFGVIEFFTPLYTPADPQLLRSTSALGQQIGQFMKRRRAENELSTSEARHRAVLATALDAIVGMDHEGRIVEFNPAAEITFGYSRDFAMGRAMAELMIPPSLRAEAFENRVSATPSWIGILSVSRPQMSIYFHDRYQAI